jgi:protein TonB
MGATIQIPAVRFEGYVEEPAQKLDAPKSSAPTSTNAVGGQRIFFVEPQYPPGAKIAHISGTVVLRATISKAGIVEKLQVVGSNPVFNNAALDAVKQWKFSPYLVNNEPTEFEKTLTVNFALNGGG